jgi:hypothetical protein
MYGMMDDLWRRDADAEYIRRAASATNIQPDWTLQAAADPRAIVRDPDPKSHIGAIRIIGYSPSAGFVITVIATGGAHAGRHGLEEQRSGSA